ncbi:hypothetical protein BDN70DRAFT_978442 [Pholiota conissans]|uniref:Uncharacterized protein n=1 Tax=Pholiota conissans TaxID=109636 RepID=A0A9P6CLY6_9AGAR|nr:hypothetical protein BDN70DRAFT_978442 [Pholiota conissans]
MFIFQRLSTELLAPPILERPLHTYTAKELEHIVFRRISSELAFAADRPPRTQRIELSEPFFMLGSCFCLLQGGRWLLVISSDLYQDRDPGCVYVYDLDKPFPQGPHRIVDTGDPAAEWRILADIDKEASSSTFNICLVPVSTVQTLSRDPANCEFDNDTYPNPRMHDPSANIHVYRLTLNGCGSDAVLKAHKLRTIYAGLGLFTGHSILCGRYIVRYIYNRINVRRVEVCNWFLSDSTHSKFYIPVTDDSVLQSNFALIPGGKLLSVNQNSISLYDITDLPTMPPGKTAANAMLQPYWQHEDASILNCLSYISKAYPDLRTNTTRVAIALEDSIHGLIIPNDTSDPWFGLICASDLLDSSSRSKWIYLGMNKTFDKRQHDYKTTTFIWPCDKNEKNGSVLVPPAERSFVNPESLTFSCDPPLLDEHSNRVFFAGTQAWHIIDYAFN